MNLRDVVDRTWSEVRLEAKKQGRARVPVVTFIDDIAASGMLHSEYRRIQFTVDPIDPASSIDADPQLLTSAVMNLLHHAFKNTPSGGGVVLLARAEQGRLLIETQAECGGIPPSKSDLFEVFGDRRPGVCLHHRRPARCGRGCPARGVVTLSPYVGSSGCLW